MSPDGRAARPARSTPSPPTGRFVGAHFKAFVGSVVAIGVIVMLAIDRLTAKQVLWVAVGVGVVARRPGDPRRERHDAARRPPRDPPGTPPEAPAPVS